MNATDPASAAASYWQMRARLVQIVYLTASATAMAGWTWLIFKEIEWLVG